MEVDIVTFCQDRLPYISFLAFDEMRKKKELCDITLKIQRNTIVAHRVILAAAIPYFRSLFSDGTDEMERKEIDIADLEPTALESLIHFAYTSKVNISGKNVRSLLTASEVLKLTGVKNACVEFLSQRLHVCSVLEVCILAHNLNNQDLIDNCNTYIQHNFEEFSKSKDFLNLPYPAMQDVISRDELNVCDETTVFEAVIKWVKSSVEKQDMLPVLLGKVRLTSLPIGYLVKRVCTEELVRASTACRDLVQDAQGFHLLPEKERTFLNLNTTPRKKIRGTIYSICNSASEGYSVYRCDFATRRWNMLKSDKSQKEHIYRVVACNVRIYVFLQNTIKTFHLKTHQWEVLKPTHDSLAGSSVLVHGYLIYCFGSDTFYLLDKVRCFDTARNKWLKEGKMKDGRASTATVSVKEFIYVTGGYRNGKTLKAAEKYDVSSGEWLQLPPMLTPRSLHGCARVNEKVYVFGGCSGGVSGLYDTNLAEVYDPVVNMWNAISPMKSAKKRFSVVSLNKKIYAFGAEMNTERSTSEVEVYDQEIDQWDSSFRIPEGFVWAVVVYAMPDQGLLKNLLY